MKYLVIAIGFLAACSKNSTGPTGADPTVLITNRTNECTGACTPAPVVFTWRDGQGITGTVTVQPGQQSCTRFTAQADSAYFEAQTNFGPSTYTQPWFDPSTRSAWTMVVSQKVGGILVTDVSPALPC